MQEDEAIKLVQEATVDTLASSTAYEGFKQRLKMESIRPVSAASSTGSIVDGGEFVEPLHHHTYEEVITDLFRLEVDHIMSQEEIMVLEEFTRVAKKKLKMKR